MLIGYIVLFSIIVHTSDTKGFASIAMSIIATGILYVASYVEDLTDIVKELKNMQFSLEHDLKEMSKEIVSKSTNKSTD
jgi:hypothetical protein